MPQELQETADDLFDVIQRGIVKVAVNQRWNPTIRIYRQIFRRLCIAAKPLAHTDLHELAISVTSLDYGTRLLRVVGVAG